MSLFAKPNWFMDLQGMQLASNKLTGTVPAAISNLTRLDTLNLASNNLQ